MARTSGPETIRGAFTMSKQKFAYKEYEIVIDEVENIYIQIFCKTSDSCVFQDFMIGENTVETALDYSKQVIDAQLKRVDPFGVTEDQAPDVPQS